MRLSGEQFRQQALALNQRLSTQIPAVEIQEVEGEQQGIVCRTRGKLLLKSSEVCDPAMLHDGLAVEICGPDR